MNIRRAALINASGKYLKVVLTLFINAVMARLLSPSDFGIVAIITVFTTFFSTISDMGLGPAIIQRRNLSKFDVDNIFTLSVYISIALSLIFFLTAHIIADFYHNEAYIGLTHLLSLSLLFNALNMIPNGILNRDKKFGLIALRTVIVYILASLVAIILAFIGFRYYSLAVQAVLTAFFSFIWNYITINPKFYWKIKKSSIDKVLNFSTYQLAFNFVNYFSRNLDNLLAGKFMGSANLGYYDKAYNLMLYPVNNLTGVVSPVLLPILADFQDNRILIYKKYLKVVKILACIGVFISPLCLLSASEIVGILYGPNWSQTIVCFKLLSIAIVPQMINASAGAIFQALDRTRLLFINSCINTFITVVAILIGIFVGKSIVALSFFISISYIIQFITAFYMLIKLEFNLSFLKFLYNLIPELILLLVLLVSVKIYPFHILNNFLSFFVKFIYLGIIFLAGVFLSGEHKLFFH